MTTAGAVVIGAEEPEPAQSPPGRRWRLPNLAKLALADLALTVLVLAVVLRVVVWALGRPIGLDEEMVAKNIRAEGLAGLAGKLGDDQAAPLGWLWLERIALVAFGQGERVMKFFPMVFAVGTVLAAYWFGRRWLSRVGAVAVTALVGFSYGLLIYSDQVKQYSSDAFWAAVVVVGAVWVVDELGSRRRWLVWWGLAVLGSWLSIGSILVVPGLVLVLAAAVLVRQGWRAMVLFGLPGVAWLVSFAAHYALSIRFITGNQYLTDFWAGLGYPPSGAGPRGLARWYVGQAEQIALDPLHFNIGFTSRSVGNVIALVFFGLVVVGTVSALRRRLWFGLVLLAPVLTALALAQLRVVPLFGRLALWVVPDLLILAAVGIDALASTLVRVRPGHATATRPSARVWQVAAAGALLASLVLVVPMVNGVRTTFGPQELNDRAAVAYMIEQQRPGDIALLVSASNRAVEWYDPDHRIGPAFMVNSTLPGQACDPAALANVLRGHSRAIVYAGARFVPYSDSYQVVRAWLERLGTIVAERHWGTYGIVYIFDLSRPMATQADPEPTDCVQVVAPRGGVGFEG